METLASGGATGVAYKAGAALAGPRAPRCHGGAVCERGGVPPWKEDGGRVAARWGRRRKKNVPVRRRAVHEEKEKWAEGKELGPGGQRGFSHFTKQTNPKSF